MAVALSAADSGALILGQENFRNAKVRQEIALDLLAWTNRLMAYVQAPTPAEIEWVRNEQAAIEALKDSNASRLRSEHFYGSPEASLMRLYHILGDMKLTLEYLVNPGNIYSPLYRYSSKTNAIDWEMAAWGTVSLNMQDERWEDSLNTLIEANRLPKDIKQKCHISESLLHTQGHGILEYIIVPHLLNHFPSRQSR
jgi:hypothetical protein